MATLDGKIAALEARIAKYESDLDAATTSEERIMYGGLITELLKQQNALTSGKLIRSFGSICINYRSCSS